MKKVSPLRRLPDTRQARVHRFTVNGVKGYVRVGLFEDGTPGEVFISMSGSKDAGPWACIGILISMALQSGVDLRVITKRLQHTVFEPGGPTSNPKIPHAPSIMDYIVRWMWDQWGDGGKP